MVAPQAETFWLENGPKYSPRVRAIILDLIRRMQAEAKETMEIVRNATGLSYALDLFTDEVDLFGEYEEN